MTSRSAGLTALVAALAASTIIATAAEASEPTPYYAPVYSWSGVYVGGLFGGGLYQSQMSDQWCYTACDAPDSSDGAFTIGGTAGWNKQFGNALIGLEADVSWTHAENKLNVSDYLVHEASMDWLATLRGRLGLVSHNALAKAYPLRSGPTRC